MARLLRLQFCMLGGNVRFHDEDPAEPLAEKPVDIDVDLDWDLLDVDLDWDLLAGKPMTMPDIPVGHLKGQLENILRKHHLLHYQSRPLPDIVTVSWTVQDAVHWTIMDHSQPGNEPYKLGRQNDEQYLWYVPNSEHGMWCVDCMKANGIGRIGHVRTGHNLVCHKVLEC